MHLNIQLITKIFKPLPSCQKLCRDIKSVCNRKLVGNKPFTPWSLTPSNLPPVLLSIAMVRVRCRVGVGVRCRVGVRVRCRVGVRVRVPGRGV